MQFPFQKGRYLHRKCGSYHFHFKHCNVLQKCYLVFPITKQQWIFPFSSTRCKHEACPYTYSQASAKWWKLHPTILPKLAGLKHLSTDSTQPLNFTLAVRAEANSVLIVITSAKILPRWSFPSKIYVQFTIFNTYFSTKSLFTKKRYHLHVLEKCL